MDFFGVISIFRKKNFFNLFYVFLAWLCCFVSLAKWNFFVIVFAPLLLVYIGIFQNDRVSFGIKSLLIGLVGTSMLLLLLNAGFFLNSFAQNAGFNDIEHYMNARVLRSTEGNNPHIDKAAIDFGTGQGLKDGGRLLMWGDLIKRTLESPLVGIGFGSRALDWMGYNMEDHNIFITFVSRFGIPLFFFWLLSTIWVFKKYYDLSKFSVIKGSSLIFLASIANFFFQSSVGNTWAQFIVAFFIGTMWGIMLDSNAITIKRKVQISSVA